MTPVSMLQERMQKIGELPRYSFTNCGSNGDLPLFNCEVTANNKTASASGKSKKEAKQSAADILLRMFQGFTEESSIEADTSQSNADKVGDNFVGILQTYCQRNIKHLPKYEVVGQSGSPHSRTFEVSCVLENLSTVGKANNKKDAKQLAARGMVNKLEWQNVSSSTPTKSTENITNDSLDSVKRPSTSVRSVTFADRNDMKYKNQSGQEFIQKLPPEKDIDELVYNLETMFPSTIDVFKVRKKKKSWNCIEDKEPNGERAHKERCDLCKKAFKDLGLFIHDGKMSAVDVLDKLREKQISISEAILHCKDKDDCFFDQLSNIGEFFDIIMNKLDCMYAIKFHTNTRNDSICNIKIKDLNNATFMGFADSTQASFKKAVVNTLRSLSEVLKKHKCGGIDKPSEPENLKVLPSTSFPLLLR